MHYKYCDAKILGQTYLPPPMQNPMLILSGCAYPWKNPPGYQQLSEAKSGYELDFVVYCSYERYAQVV